MQSIKTYKYSDTARTVLITPMGRKFTLDSADEVSRLLPEDDQKVWKSGSGSAEIRYYSHEDAYQSLSIMCRPGVGFHVTFAKFAQDIHVPESTFIAVKDADFTHKTSLWVGGDYYLFPTACFLEGSVFRKVVADFYKSGEMSESIAWEKQPLPIDDEHIYGERY